MSAAQWATRLRRLSVSGDRSYQFSPDEVCELADLLDAAQALADALTALRAVSEHGKADHDNGAWHSERSVAMALARVALARWPR